MLEIVEDVAEAHDAEDEEPDRGDRRKQRGHAGGALVLKQEQGDQDAERQRHDIGLEAWVDDVQALDGR